MPSTSCGPRPASAIARETASCASCRVVFFAPRTYAVSPTPTIANLSRSAVPLSISISFSSCMVPLSIERDRQVLDDRRPQGLFFLHALAQRLGVRIGRDLDAGELQLAPEIVL